MASVLVFSFQPGLPEAINFDLFICEKVEVRFALANSHGVSDFSPPFNLHIQGGKLIYSDQSGDFRSCTFLRMLYLNDPSLALICCLDMCCHADLAYCDGHVAM